MKRAHYEKDGVLRPVLQVIAKDPLQHSETELIAKVDSGSEGGLMIPFDDHLKLGLQRLEEPGSKLVARWVLGLTMRQRASRGVFEVGS